MKAWQIINNFGLENLHLVDLAATDLKPDEIRVNIKACSLNFRDLMVINGAYNPSQKLPLIPLSDASGIVTEVGAEVKNFKVSDRVASCFFADHITSEQNNPQTSALGSPLNGVLQTECVFKTSGLVKIPDYLSYTQAATLPCAGLTAFNALFNNNNLKPGDTILLIGTGGVSLFALQFANALGLNSIVISSSDEKLALCKELGAKYLINYQKNPDWDKQVLEITNNKGVELVIELAGAQTINKSLKTTKRGGNVAVIGVLSGTHANIDLIPILMNSLQIRGIFVGTKIMFEQMNRVLNHTHIMPYIDKEFSFAQTKEAFLYLASQKHCGKICINLEI